MTAEATTAAFRFGYGLPQAAGANPTPKAMLARLQGPDDMARAHPIVGFDWVHQREAELAVLKRKLKTDAAARTRTEEIVAERRHQGLLSLRATIARALDAPDGFRERLHAFWADHFTVSANGRDDAISPYAFAEDTLRPHLAGRFGDMLAAVVTHPVMLLYLDQTRSIGPGSRRGKRKGGGLNENLAREVLELHTLGVEAEYSQDDVRQLAELLTGLTYTPRGGRVFEDNFAEPGAETILGRSYDGAGEAPIRAFLHDLAVHPATARHVSWKLAVHFLSDTPDPGLVSTMAKAWRDSGGDLAVVYGTMLRHPSAWNGPAAKARQPWDFLLAALRGLQVSGSDIMALPQPQLFQGIIYPMRAMGQVWKSPPGPDGWPEDIETWITPQALAERIGWAMRWPAVLAKPLPEPRAFADTVLGARASEATLWACVRAESRMEGVGIVLASPEFNRR